MHLYTTDVIELSHIFKLHLKCFQKQVNLFQSKCLCFIHSISLAVLLTHCSHQAKSYERKKFTFIEHQSHVCHSTGLISFCKSTPNHIEEVPETQEHTK
jgi:hypothetical protein